jgi:hypothetical protein
MWMLRLVVLACAVVPLAVPRAEAATFCGFSCPAGQYAQSFSFNSSCCASPTSCNPAVNNQVSCALSSPPSFLKCGTVCPSGFHSFQLTFTASCCTNPAATTCDGLLRNQAFCVVNWGTSFEACGGCPAGYTVSRRYFKADCCGSFASSTCSPLTNNAVTCRKI